jgi:NAD(P)-dependent dehydrogenase (short-subunit alcohol dehydrogenase family)
MVSLVGRVAIVTGAGRGLGRAHAMLLAALGARVVVNDLGGDMAAHHGSSEAADGVVDEIRAAGGDAIASYHSVADPEAARALVALALEAFGSLDVVVNNAGTFGGGPFEQTSMEDFRELVGVHLFGAANVMHAAWPILKARRYGRAVLTVSSAGMWGMETSQAYSAAKAGVMGLGRSLAHEGAAHGIKVNLIAPGAKTRASEALFGGKAAHTWRPELVSPAVGYLCSEECRHTGAIFAALAGQYARIEVVQAVGARFDPRGDISVDDFIAQLDRIDDLAGAKSMEHGLSSSVRSSAERPTNRV